MMSETLAYSTIASLQVLGAVRLINAQQETFGLEHLAGQYVGVYFSAHWVSNPAHM